MNLIEINNADLARELYRLFLCDVAKGMLKRRGAFVVTLLWGDLGFCDGGTRKLVCAAERDLLIRWNGRVATLTAAGRKVAKS